MALTVSARSKFSGPSTATLIKGAAICAGVGIASSLTEAADFGKWLAAAGVLLLVVGLHRFGRMGPDPAIVFELEPPRRKKKRKHAPAEPPAAEQTTSEPEPSADEPSADPGAGEGEAER